MLKAYNFMLIDLQLYLDVHPEDENVKELFNEYVRRWHETKENVQKSMDLCILLQQLILKI